jgi:hypothetical protein
VSNVTSPTWDTQLTLDQKRALAANKRFALAWISLLAARGVSDGEIAALMGRSREAVKQLRRRNGISPGQPPEQTTPKETTP